MSDSNNSEPSTSTQTPSQPPGRPPQAEVLRTRELCDFIIQHLQTFKLGHKRVQLPAKKRRKKDAPPPSPQYTWVATNEQDEANFRAKNLMWAGFVTRAMHEAAMDCLWGDLPGFCPLLFTIPIASLVEGGSGRRNGEDEDHEGTRSWIFTDMLAEDNIGNFLAYASRVRSVTLDAEKWTISPQVYMEFSRFIGQNQSQIFPKLRTLKITDFTESANSIIHLLLFDSVTNLQITAPLKLRNPFVSPMFSKLSASSALQIVQVEQKSPYADFEVPWAMFRLKGLETLTIKASDRHITAESLAPLSANLPALAKLRLSDKPIPGRWDRSTDDEHDVQNPTPLLDFQHLQHLSLWPSLATHAKSLAQLRISTTTSGERYTGARPEWKHLVDFGRIASLEVLSIKAPSWKSCGTEAENSQVFKRFMQNLSSSTSLHTLELPFEFHAEYDWRSRHSTPAYPDAYTILRHLSQFSPPSLRSVSIMLSVPLEYVAEKVYPGCLNGVKLKKAPIRTLTVMEAPNWSYKSPLHLRSVARFLGASFPVLRTLRATVPPNSKANDVRERWMLINLLRRDYKKLGSSVKD
ncbi:hypothetical protein CC1G_09483 [Coprinopsis cinerea okayama7|uniref:F-box domain-containing protein n=1 Tax=Coprinopsis cinerea (strain Okayama-7 / 130 / ATCC MYA-4618 / FGSC 9003) TaxID=240176 RepID=A8PDH3_COPC7|nr:hypothetical protein CC1G_09483 [Coprinopsis cinerea okayama7\|eukprot:XP_001840599.2 hypothetical protein CC1G_09483 [Coprinopsis cinerea okayama7\